MHGDGGFVAARALPAATVASNSSKVRLFIATAFPVGWPEVARRLPALMSFDFNDRDASVDAVGDELDRLARL